MSGHEGCGPGCEGHEATELDFVFYEIEMFRTAYEAWQQYSEDGFLNNSFLEVFLLHFRALHEFLHSDGELPEGALEAQEFFDTEEEYEGFLKDRCGDEDLAYLVRQDARAHKRLAPLTLSRLEDMEEWDIHKIHDAMNKSIEAFIQTVPDLCADQEEPAP
ncbi:MAG: hypothetical protein HY894_04670 [Deltaproteobacteria bacterium]|nr:hypothetical protein [Deltaproteobacteria bacterium]